MKSIFQITLLTAIAIYVTTLITPGLVITGGYVIFLGAAFAFVIANAILKPLLSLFAFPFAFLSGAVVLVLSNTVALYLTALILKSVKVTSFNFQSVNMYGIRTQSFQVGDLLSYLIISAIIALFVKILSWVFELD